MIHVFCYFFGGSYFVMCWASEFVTYLQLGWRHIIDIHAYDHLLFVLTLCATFVPSEWRRLLILITAFTVGHSLTLALAALDILLLPTSWVEAFIPCTIIATAVYNIFTLSVSTSFNRLSSKNYCQYILTLFFGLIHGLGFAGYFKFLMGQKFSILHQLLAFNIGLEIGQICIVICFMVFWGLLIYLGAINRRDWVLLISGAGGGIAFTLLIDVLTGGK